MIKWVKDGRTLNLDSKPYILMDHDKLGMPDTPRIEDSGPLQHGTTDRGIKLSARKIVLYIKVFASSWEHYYQLRAELLRYFNPLGNEGGTLTVEEGGVTRAIKGFPVAGLDYTAKERNFQTQTVPIVLHCPDPLWYDPSVKSLSFGAGSDTDIGTVPMSVPFEVGTSSIGETGTITYKGSFESFPKEIRIYGAITDPVLVNNATGAVLDFTGTTIAAGDYYTIELGYGRNRIYDNSGNNQIDKLSEDSDITGFKLMPNTPNSITVTGASVSGTTNIYLLWYERYLGI
jgi:hypothetical protein